MRNGEWAIYEYCWHAAHDPVFAALRDFALSPVHATDPAGSVAIDIQPMRFSGDMNTSLGNSINNWLALYAALHHVKSPDPRAFVIEGDDAILVLERKALPAF